MSVIRLEQLLRSDGNMPADAQPSPDHDLIEF
jgi:hypothetical protein